LHYFCRDKLPYLVERPTVQLTSKDRSVPVSCLDPPPDVSGLRQPRTLRHSPLDPTLPPLDANLGAVSRLEALIEKTPDVGSAGSKANTCCGLEDQQPEPGVKKLHRSFVSEFKEHSIHIDRPVSIGHVGEKVSSESAPPLKTVPISGDVNKPGLSYAKSVPNLVDIEYLPVDRQFSTPIQTILSNNLSVSLPFDLDELEATPKPCDVTEYNDHFSVEDKNILEHSEQRRRLSKTALRYRSSIRIMVRPEAPAGILANVDNMAEISSDKSKEYLTGPMPHRSIVKEQFR
jgi:hypothetical protein